MYFFWEAGQLPTKSGITIQPLMRPLMQTPHAWTRHLPPPYPNRRPLRPMSFLRACLARHAAPRLSGVAQPWARPGGLRQQLRRYATPQSAEKGRGARGACASLLVSPQLRCTPLPHCPTGHP